MSGETNEEGVSIVEVMMASLVGIIVILMMSTSLITLTRNSVGAIKRGSSTGPALVTAQAIEQILSGVWNPATGSLPATCYDPTGGGFHGAFTTANAMETMFCGYANNSLTPYTYDLRLNGSTLTLSKETSGGAITSWVVGQTASSGSAFSYSCYQSGWTTTSTPTTTQMPNIKSITFNFSVGATGGTGATVQRTVMLAGAGG